MRRKQTHEDTKRDKDMTLIKKERCRERYINTPIRKKRRAEGERETQRKYTGIQKERESQKKEIHGT